MFQLSCFALISQFYFLQDEIKINPFFGVILKNLLILVAFGQV